MVPTTPNSDGIKQIRANTWLGRPYTLARFDEKGSVVQTCFFLENISYKPYKQFRNTALLVAAGSAEVLKWNKFIRIHEGAPFILWEGTWKVNTEKIVTRTSILTECGSCIAETCWPRFDPRYMVRALNSVRVKPVASFVPAIVEEEILLPYQTISK